MTDNQRLIETVTGKESIYPGRIIHVQKWTVTLPDGTEAMREIVQHNGASAIVAVDDQGQVILVRQHRVAVGRVTWEIPAGKFDHPGEDPLACARRELEEETGMSADHWRELVAMDSTPGFCTECIHIFLATGLHEGSSHPDEDEFVDVTAMPLRDAAAKVMRGEIRDSKTALAIMMADKIFSASSI